MTGRSHTQVKTCIVLLLATFLSGCASAEMFFVNPGGFDYLSCADLADKTHGTREREQELKMLIERAEQGTFGTFVADTAYRSQYLKAQGDLKLLAETAERKNCPVPAGPPAPALPGPADPAPR